MRAIETHSPSSKLVKEALRLLEGGGMILDLARELSGWLRAEGIDGRVVGGLAVVLHGYVRTTLDIDLHTTQPDRVAEMLRGCGAAFDPDRREYTRDGVPIHLFLPEQTGPLRFPNEEIDGMRTADLGDLLTMKLRSGTTSLRRAKDLADVVELVQRKGLSKAFASRIGKDQRAAFRKLVEQLQAEG